MNTVVATILFAVGFIGMPLVFFYIMVIVPYKKYKRCSERVEGKIIDIYKNRYVYKDSDNHTRIRISYIATCEYYFRGEKHIGEVESKGRKFSSLVGEMLNFYINPDNPLETYLRSKSQMGQSIIVTVFLMTFIIAGGYTISDMLTPESVSSDIKQEQVYNEDIASGNGTVGSESEESETAVNDESNSNNLDVSEQINKEKSDEDNITNKDMGQSAVILANKNVKNDMNPKFIKNAKKVTMDGVVLCVPKTFKANIDTLVQKQFWDTVSGDNFIIKVADTTKEIYDHHVELRETIKQKYHIDQFDVYKYNGNDFLVACTLDNSGMMFVIAVNEKKNIYMVYKPGKATSLDLRDILSTVIF